MRALSVFCVGASIVLGCTLFVESSDLDAGCPVGQKLCPDYGCVGLDDPSFGCGLDVCLPCERPNANPVCENGRCAIGSCVYPYGCSECTANLLTDEANCGACMVRCDGGLCENGSCSGN